MAANRWFHLRHPEGFDDTFFQTFRAECRIWRAYIEAVLEGWDYLSPGRSGIPKPVYEFGEAMLEEDGKVVTFSIGGEVSYGALKFFEDEFPQQLYMDFPLWFRLDLEFGRRDLLGWSPVTRWWPLIDPEKREAVRSSPLFQR